MTTISRNRRGQSGRLKTLVALVCALLLLVVLIFWRTAVAGAVWQLLTPVLHARDAFFSSDTDALEAQLASTTALVADRDTLYQENLQLKTRLSRDGSLQTILAGVIGRPPATPYDTLMIDAGSDQGVEQNNLVSAGGEALIGAVVQVYPTSARVELFTAPGSSYQALLRGAIPVTMEGQGGGSMTGEVPADVQVSAGDSIIFPGIAGGLGGSVSAVAMPQGASFKTIYAQLAVDPLELRYVEVWKNSDAQE